MSAERNLEASAPLTEQPERDTDVAAPATELGECVVCLLPLEDHFRGPHCSGTALGCRGARTASPLFDRQLAKALGFGLTQFYKRKKRGEFARFELSPQLPDSNTRYSGALVQRWLDGERLDETAVPPRHEWTGVARRGQFDDQVPRARNGDGNLSKRKSDAAKPTVTVTEAARLLGVGRHRMYEAVRRGQVRSIRLGEQNMIPRAVIDELLAARYNCGAPAAGGGGSGAS